MTSARPSISRRGFLQAGALAWSGLTLAQLFRFRAEAVERGRENPPTSVILLWLEGGPSHLETYDPKPDAPREFRGEFAAIESAVTGMLLSEHLPLHARAAGRFSIIRSIAHNVADHPGAAGRFLTGRQPVNISDPVSKHPTVESIVAHQRLAVATGVPVYVSNVPGVKGGGSGFLGANYEPFVVDADPNAPDFRVENISLAREMTERLGNRAALLRGFDRLRRGLDLTGAMEAGDRFDRQALELLVGDQTRRAFDLSAEPDVLRERYGRHEWGQRCLLARRLVEAGCSFVTVQLWSKSHPTLLTWDDHGDVAHIFEALKYRLPLLDRCLTALIDDLYERGLERQVLVLATGEFGRTPQVNMGRAAVPKNPGRDHWPDAMSVLVSGGGLQMGQVIGATNARGEHPQSNRLDPNDLLATIYRFLGIDPEYSLLDLRGRPLPILPYGTPISGL